MDSVLILNVRVDRLTMAEALEQVSTFVKGQGKHLIVTPNIEFVIKAQHDQDFRDIINEADLAIPDSARFGWAHRIITEQSFVKRLLLWPTFFVGNKLSISNFPVVTGTDLMDQLCKQAAQKGWTVGLIGGKPGIAEQTSKKLQQRYPQLQVNFAEQGGVIDDQGQQLDHDGLDPAAASKLSKTDLLFVAFGQGKQEKWIHQNLKHLPVKVAMGVGGAFDYLSGSVPRAPQWMRNLGLEWFYRLLQQPWRIRRFKALVDFVLLVLFEGLS